MAEESLTKAPIDWAALPPVVAVRAMVTDASGRLLILKRGDDVAGGQWCLPGGKVDYGESVVEACRREVAEETGLVCQSPTFLFYQDSPPLVPQGMHFVVLYFSCRLNTEQPQVRLGAEEAAARWVEKTQLSGLDLAFRGAEAVQRWLKGFHGN